MRKQKTMAQYNASIAKTEKARVTRYANRCTECGRYPATPKGGIPHRNSCSEDIKNQLHLPLDKQVKLCYVYSMKNNTVVNVSKFAEQFRIYTHDSWGHVWVRHIEDHSITAMSRWNSIAPVPGQVNGSYQDAINEATGSILDQLYAQEII